MGVSRGGALWAPPPPHLGGIRGSTERWALRASVSFLRSGESPHRLAPLPPLWVQAGWGGGSPIGVNMELLESSPLSPHHITSTALGVPTGAPPPTPGPKWDSAPLTPMPRGQRGPGTAVHRTRLCSQPELNPPPLHTPPPRPAHPHISTPSHITSHTTGFHTPPHVTPDGAQPHTHTLTLSVTLPVTRISATLTPRSSHTRLAQTPLTPPEADTHTCPPPAPPKLTITHTQPCCEHAALPHALAATHTPCAVCHTRK